MTLNYLLYFCTPAKISIIFKYEHITPKKWMRLVKPKKALGQHFLKDLQIAERIADTLSDYKQLPVLEIGPGMGVLTQFLLEKGHDLTVVELDMESVDYLEQNFPVLEGKILAEDFLRLDLGKLFPDQFCAHYLTCCNRYYDLPCLNQILKNTAKLRDSSKISNKNK